MNAAQLILLFHSPCFNRWMPVDVAGVVAAKAVPFYLIVTSKTINGHDGVSEQDRSGCPSFTRLPMYVRTAVPMELLHDGA